MHTQDSVKLRIWSKEELSFPPTPILAPVSPVLSYRSKDKGHMPRAGRNQVRAKITLPPCSVVCARWTLIDYSRDLKSSLIRVFPHLIVYKPCTSLILYIATYSGISIL